MPWRSTEFFTQFQNGVRSRSSRGFRQGVHTGVSVVSRIVRVLELSIQKRRTHDIYPSMKGDRLGEFEEFTLLAVRALGDHTYAVPVQQYVEELTGRNVSLGAVYAALGRLEAKGFLRSVMSDALPQPGGKPRRLFEVTPVGLRTAKELHRIREKIWNQIAEARRS